MPVEHDKIVNTVHDRMPGKIERADIVHDDIEPVQGGGKGCCHFAFVFNKQQAHELFSAVSGVRLPGEEGARGHRINITVQ